MSLKPHSDNPFDTARNKNRKINNRIYNLAYSVFTVAMVCVVLFCGFVFVDKYFNDYVTEQDYSDLRGDVPSVAPSRQVGGFGNSEFPSITLNPGGVSQPQRPTVEYVPTEIEKNDGYVNREKQVWNLYENTNPETVGWLYIPEVTSYPVMMNDNEYYLTHTYNGNESAAGALFMTSLNELNPPGRNTIIHGHNMTNETMFGKLKYYTTLGTQAFYDTHKRVYLDTLYGTFRFEIFSVYITNKDDTDYRKHYFSSDDEYVEYLKRIRDRGMFKDADIQFTAQDRVLTLSTCNADEGSTKRTIVHARLVWPDPQNIKPVVTPNVTPSVTPDITLGPDDTPSPGVTDEPIVDNGERRVVKLSNKNGSLKLRAGQSTSAEILDNLKHGTVLTVIEDGETWIKVQTPDGKIGYVSKSYTVPYDQFDFDDDTAGTTNRPTNTVKPEDTTSPEDTVSPGDTTSPEDTVSPEDTTSPEDTVAPEDTKSPENTVAPEDTTSPENTVAPENTIAPENTAADGE